MIFFNKFIKLCLITSLIGCADFKTKVDDNADFTYHYLGLVESAGEMQPVITVLKRKNSIIKGEYKIYEGKQKKYYFGKLYKCKKKDLVLTCSWSDKYGIGSLQVLMTDGFKNFSGKWQAKGEKVEYKWNGVLDSNSSF